MANKPHTHKSGPFQSKRPNETIALSGYRTGIIMKRRSGKTYVAVIDSADYPIVEKYRWVVLTTKPSHRRNTSYAWAKVRGSDGKRRELYMHTLLAPPGGLCDLADRNGLNNCRSNLRPATNSENGQNQTHQTNNKAKVKGVHFASDRGYYRAQIAVDGVIHWLGQFATAEEAGRAYDEAALRLHPYACLNFPTTSELPVH